MRIYPYLSVRMVEGAPYLRFVNGSRNQIEMMGLASASHMLLPNPRQHLRDDGQRKARQRQCDNGKYGEPQARLLHTM